MCLPAEELTKILDEVSQSNKPELAEARRIACRVLATAKRELSSVLNTTANQLRFLDTPKMREHVSKSNFDFAWLVRGDMDCFLCFDQATLISHQRLIKLYTWMAYNSIQRQQKCPEHNVLFLLEELPQLGRLDFLKQAIGMGAGFGVSIVGVTQTLGQLKAIYGKEWDTLMTGSLVLFLAVRDVDTAQYVSKWLGNHTVSFDHTTHGRSQSKKGDHNQQSNQSTQYVSRPLVLPHLKKPPKVVVIAHK